MNVGQAAQLLGVTPQHVLNRPELLKALRAYSETPKPQAQPQPAPTRDGAEVWAAWAAATGIRGGAPSRAAVNDAAERAWDEYARATGARR